MNKYLIINILILFLLWACADQHVVEEGFSSRIHLNITADALSPQTVATRGLSLSEQEKKINNLHLFLFDLQGRLVPNSGNQSYQYFETTTGNIALDLDQFSEKEEMTCCIVANYPHDLSEEVSTLSDLKNLLFVLKDEQTPGLPKKGLLMYHESAFNPFDKSNGKQFNLPLKSLYARIDFTINFLPEQHTALTKLRLKGYSIHNLPQGGRLQDVNEGLETDLQALTFYNSGDIVYPEDQNTISPSEKFEFTFYMPELVLQPKDDAPSYPDNTPDTEKQRFKPEKAKDQAAYVKLNMDYINESGAKLELTYTLYLGANHVDNFEIRRGNRYHNILNIVDKNSNKDEDRNTIAYDARVEINSTTFYTSCKRQILLDSHIEYRPVYFILEGENSRLDVEIDGSSYRDSYLEDQGRVEVVTTNPVDMNWVAMDRSQELQEYFTDKIFSSSEHKISIYKKDGDDNKIYFYFKENPYYSKEGYRQVKAKMTYYHDTKDVDPTSVEYITFMQKDLFFVQYPPQQGAEAERHYLIEQYEEYLYNYDPKLPWTPNEEGLPWGADGTQLSNEDILMRVNTNDHVEFRNTMFSEMKPYYDYDDPYRGARFTHKTVVNAGVTQKPLSSIPEIAAEYCYNKNLRSENGEVKHMNWYMPAIKELEEVCEAAYSDFSSFQSKLYWSSQAAYDVNGYYLKPFIRADSVVGDFLSENTTHARATKVNYFGNDQFEMITSDSDRPTNEELLQSLGHFNQIKSTNYAEPTVGILNRIKDFLNLPTRPTTYEEVEFNGLVRVVRRNKQTLNQIFTGKKQKDLGPYPNMFLVGELTDQTVLKKYRYFYDLYFLKASTTPGNDRYPEYQKFMATQPYEGAYQVQSFKEGVHENGQDACMMSFNVFENPHPIKDEGVKPRTERHQVRAIRAITDELKPRPGYPANKDLIRGNYSLEKPTLTSN